VPININTSFLENVSMPFDLASIIMMIISVLTTAVVWKILSKNSQSKFPFSFIFMNIFKCTIGLSFEKEDKMSRKEKILLYFFSFSSIILVSFYQSILIAIMLTETEMRSIQSVEELNNSNTRIFQFIKNNEIQFRDDLVLKIVTDISLVGSFLQIPSDFDPDLAYFVPCAYAESFVKSNLNYNNGKRIFNVLPEVIASYPEAIQINPQFPYKREIQFAMEQLRESGIRNYWKSGILKDSKVRSHISNDNDYLDFKRLWFPIVILGIGALTGLLIFIFEHIIMYIQYERSKRVIVIN
jgi:hypothetical protein